jgi:SNF2 family DNA or RNA helicase
MFDPMTKAYRTGIGQTRPVICKRLIIENSIEARILELQKKKENMFVLGRCRVSRELSVR